MGSENLKRDPRTMALVSHMRHNAEPSGKQGVYTLGDMRLRCVVDEETGCWHWRGALCTSDNVPKLWLPAVGKTLSGPKAAAILSGRQVFRGQIAFRTCHCLDCMNPMHIAVGSRAEAGRSRAKGDRLKGNVVRAATMTRVMRDRSVLTEAMVREIRTSTEPAVVIAKRLGITKSNVSHIRCGRTWRDVAMNASVFTWRPAA